MHIGPPVNYPLPLSDLMKLSRHIFEKYSVGNFMKISPEGAELLMRTDRQINRQT